MSISGELQDVSIAEVMQFVHLGRRTGTLAIRSGELTAEIGFHRGKIISAWRPESRRLGELLLEEGAVDPELLEAALARQRDETPKTSLGKLLLSMKAVSEDRLREVLGRRIERTIYELVTWREGSFEFALNELRPIDDIGVYPGDILPDINLDTQMVVLDALRIFDERNRRGAAGGDGGSESPEESESVAPEPRAAKPEPPDTDELLVDLIDGVEARAPDGALAAHPASPLRLQVVSNDRDFLEELTTTVPSELASVVPMSLLDAGLTLPGEAPPLVLVDLRGAASLEDIESLERSRPHASLLAVAELDQLAEAYSAGALAAVPASTQAVIGCLKSISKARREYAPGGAGRASARAGFAKLRRVVADLRSGLLSATVALNLMQVISESVERAIMFLVRDDRLLALGAFGSNADGNSLAILTSGLKIPFDKGGALVEALDHGEARSMMFEEANLPPAMVEFLGRPRTGQVVIFPVLGSERVISVVYADNGPISREIEEIEILDLATAQVGVALENEMLRRRMDGGQ